MMLLTLILSRCTIKVTNTKHFSLSARRSPGKKKEKKKKTADGREKGSFGFTKLDSWLLLSPVSFANACTQRFRLIELSNLDLGRSLNDLSALERSQRNRSLMNGSVILSRWWFNVCDLSRHPGTAHDLAAPERKRNRSNSRDLDIQFSSPINFLRAILRSGTTHESHAE